MSAYFGGIHDLGTVRMVSAFYGLYAGQADFPRQPSHLEYVYLADLDFFLTLQRILKCLVTALYSQPQMFNSANGIKVHILYLEHYAFSSSAFVKRFAFLALSASPLQQVCTYQ